MTKIISQRDFTPKPAGRGLVQIFTGDGKGKTTSAVGTILRAVGHDLRVSVIFFMKGDYAYGERKILAGLPGVTVKSFGGEDFVFPDKIKPEQKNQAEQALAAARTDILSGNYDLVVLDEINVTAAFKLISVEEVLQLIKDKPEKLEMILTGRKADPRLVQAADLVTEMIKIKHPYDQGLPARPGVDY
jgi:cob(I)alamin adenosyltransferase